MSGTRTPPPEHLALWSRVLRGVARAGRLSHEDAQDFAQSAQVRVLERDYDIFHRFAGRSSMRTYLTVVANRMLLDWRNGMYGKWRPSAKAASLGDDAVAIERLVHRDGYTVDEAIGVLASMNDARSTLELTRLADLLPARQKRRMVPEETLDHVARLDFEDPIDSEEASCEERRTRTALEVALRQLSAEDRWLIHARYEQQRSVQAVAATLQTDPKSLYRQFDRVLRSLREALKAAGVASYNHCP